MGRGSTPRRSHRRSPRSPSGDRAKPRPRVPCRVRPEDEKALGLDPEEALKGWARPVYLVHEHRTKRPHFDLRLELDGVLKSWAVPKGMPLEPGVRRLAVEVEDHALSYAVFEGEIPEGEYGAGRVAIWDKGTFRVLERTPDKLVVEIAGQRVEGPHHLVRTRMNDDPRNWLVFRAKA